jgi:Na+/phosphate symporter
MTPKELSKERKEAFKIAKDALKKYKISFTEEDILVKDRQTHKVYLRMCVALVLIGKGYTHKRLAPIFDKKYSNFSHIRGKAIKSKDEIIVKIVGEFMIK